MTEDDKPKMHSFRLHKSEKPKRSLGKRILLWVVSGFVLICIITALGSNSKSPSSANTAATSSSQSSSKSTSAPAATVGLNQQANDGKLGFTITSLKCGVNRIDQPGDTYGYESTTTGAPYCVMNLAVKGVSTAAQTFDSTSQYIYSSTGTQYSVDSDAMIDANDAGSNCMLDPTVNPGVTLTCKLVFDVPAGTTPTYAMLHDSSLSDGVKVNLQ